MADQPWLNTTPGHDKLGGIDATRGWAIILVMLVHSLGIFPELPWPAKKIGAFGWYGVQLFFVASALTLMLSWHRQQSALPEKLSSFFVRRFFRIAPMYYLAAIVYVFLRPPESGLDLGQFFLTLAFLNGWHPVWMGLGANDWQVVPGGWSISVEFSFYFLFPLFAVWISSLRRALGFFLVALVLMLVSFPAGMVLLQPGFSSQILELFLFFWFPNQLVIFAIGIALFWTLADSGNVSGRIRASIGRHGPRYLLVSLLLLFTLTQVGVSKTVVSQAPWLPTHVLVSLLFAVIILAILLSENPFVLYSNRFTRSLGEVSFSAYLIHWAVIDFLRYLGGADVYDRSMSGFPAIVATIFAFGCVVVVTYLIAKLTYQCIEKPFITMSKKLKPFHKRTQ